MLKRIYIEIDRLVEEKLMVFLTGTSPASFVYLVRSFLNTMTHILRNSTINGKCEDGVLGIRTLGW